MADSNFRFFFKLFTLLFEFLQVPYLGPIIVDCGVCLLLNQSHAKKSAALRTMPIKEFIVYMSLTCKLPDLHVSSVICRHDSLINSPRNRELRLKSGHVECRLYKYHLT